MAQFITLDTSHSFQDQALLLDYREAVQYDLDLPDWSGLKIGILWGVVDSATNQPIDTNYSEGFSTSKDYFWFGIKNSGSSFPDELNSHFIGARIQPRTYNDGYYGYLRMYNTVWAHVSSSINYSSPWGTQYIGGRFNPTDSGSLAGPAQFTGIKYDRETDNKRIRITTTSNNSVVGVNSTTSTYTDSILRNLLAGNSYVSGNGSYQYVGTWVTGSESGPVPLDVPKSLFVYCPLSSRRLVIHAIGALAVE